MIEKYLKNLQSRWKGTKIGKYVRNFEKRENRDSCSFVISIIEKISLSKDKIVEKWENSQKIQK